VIGHPRVTILYPAGPGAHFDFGYYVPNHLPLAVGTSLRHAAITWCDASRPITPDTPYACICTVGFDSVEAMDNFRHFFASGHPETARILDDEPNYTNITPLFVAGMAHGEVVARPAPGTSGYRMQLIFPARAGNRFDRHGFSELPFLNELGLDVPGLFTEVDCMTAGVMPDSAPEFHCIWTGWASDRGALDALAARWSGNAGAILRARLVQITDVSAQAVFAEVLTLDMARARAIAQQP
jgi:uncharacterized protein (TIGR02118 family)